MGTILLFLMTTPGALICVLILAAIGAIFTPFLIWEIYVRLRS